MSAPFNFKPTPLSLAFKAKAVTLLKVNAVCSRPNGKNAKEEQGSSLALGLKQVSRKRDGSTVAEKAIRSTYPNPANKRMRFIGR